MANFNKRKVQKLAYKELLAIVKDPTTSAAVKVQALTQISKLADMLPDTTPDDELDAFLSHAK